MNSETGIININSLDKETKKLFKEAGINKKDLKNPEICKALIEALIEAKINNKEENNSDNK